MTRGDGKQWDLTEMVKQYPDKWCIINEFESGCYRGYLEWLCDSFEEACETVEDLDNGKLGPHYNTCKIPGIDVIDKTGLKGQDIMLGDMKEQDFDLLLRKYDRVWLIFVESILHEFYGKFYAACKTRE